ncbi:MAG TPA: uroporphyrinogen-III C-methyltransferase [Microbacteriaceae bacterium]
MTSRGRVYLVGGGPGNVELLTVAAVRALRIADVVLYDRLAPHDELCELAPHARLVDVGKAPGRHPVGQDEIARLMIEHAQAGRCVVRLKGGDPFVFGRGGEEAIACRAAGVPVTVVPGVSSVASVPASAGIPITQRGVSHLFTVVSGHAPLSAAEHEHLAGLGGTIIVLMGVGTLPTLAAGLLRHGLAASVPVAIIEGGYSDQQRTTVASLGTVVVERARVGVRSPAVIVIGNVVALAHDGDAHAWAQLRHAGDLAVL